LNILRRLPELWPFSGLPEFKKSVADHFNTEKHGSFSPENVLAVNSAAQGMLLVAKYVLNPEMKLSFWIL
jgi:aminotransferase/cystathionine beta-lyase